MDDHSATSETDNDTTIIYIFDKPNYDWLFLLRAANSLKAFNKSTIMKAIAMIHAKMRQKPTEQKYANWWGEMHAIRNQLQWKKNTTKEIEFLKTAAA